MPRRAESLCRYGESNRAGQRGVEESSNILIFVFEAFIPCFSWPFRANYRQIVHWRWVSDSWSVQTGFQRESIQ
jgi:hypothetical protein